MIEEWREAPGWQGKFEVSSLGLVRSVDRTITTKNGVRRRVYGRILKGYWNSDGYNTIGVRVDGKTRGLQTHVLVCTAFHGPCPPGKVLVRHLDNDTANNSALNLRWGTKSENALDFVATGEHHLRLKARCPRGHDLEGANLRADGLRKGWRKCLACNRAQAYCRYHGIGDVQSVADSYYEKILKEDQ